MTASRLRYLIDRLARHRKVGRKVQRPLPVALRCKGLVELVELELRKGILDAVRGHRAAELRVDASRPLSSKETQRNWLQFEDPVLTVDGKLDLVHDEGLRPDFTARDCRGCGEALQELRGRPRPELHAVHLQIAGARLKSLPGSQVRI